MLSFDRAIYLSLLSTSIVSGKLSNSLKDLNVLLFLVFMNIASKPLLNSLCCYILLQ